MAELVYRVRKAGLKHPVGARLTVDQVEAMRNKKQLIKTRHIEAVVVERKEKSK